MVSLPRLRFVGRLVEPPGWDGAEHHHTDSHEMVMVVEGEVETVMAGNTNIAGPGMIKFHPRAVAHAERALHGEGAVLLVADWSYADSCDISHWPHMVSDRTGRIRQLFELMIELAPTHDAQTQAALDSLLNALTFLYVGSGHGEHDALVQVIRAWVRQHLAEPIRLDDLAAAAGLSRFHFHRVFSRAVGRSPMRFVRELRADAARALLLNTTLPLREIAPQGGFSDEFKLSRVFRQVTGQSPGSIRRGRR